MKRAIWLAAFLMVTASAVRGAAPSGSHFYAGEVGYWVFYEDGAYRVLSDERLRAAEAQGREGHMPWRTRPLLVASVEGMALLPPGMREYGDQLTPTQVAGHDALVGRHSTWVLVKQGEDDAFVRASVRGRPFGELRLFRPFGFWWYVSRARRLDGPRSRIVLVHPDGTREFLSGPLLLRNGRAYLPARDLSRLSLLVDWDAQSHAARLGVPHSDYVVWFRAGRRTMTGRGPQAFTQTLSWHPFLHRGRLYVSASGVAALYSDRFVVIWRPREGVLELRPRPLGATR